MHLCCQVIGGTLECYAETLLNNPTPCPVGHLSLFSQMWILGLNKYLRVDMEPSLYLTKVIITDSNPTDIYSHMLDLPEAIEVHWRHKAAGLESLTVVANKTGESPDSNGPHEIDAYFPPVAASDLLSTSIFKNQAQASSSPRPSTVDYGASEIQVMLPEGPSLTDLKTRDHYGLTLSGPTTEIKVVFSPKRRKLASEDLNCCRGGGDGCEAVSNDTSLDHEHPEGEVLLLDNTDLGHFNLTSCNKRQGK